MNRRELCYQAFFHLFFAIIIICTFFFPNQLRWDLREKTLFILFAFIAIYDIIGNIDNLRKKKHNKTLGIAGLAIESFYLIAIIIGFTGQS